MGMQHPLGVARGAGGVDHHRRIIGSGRQRLVRYGPCDQVLEGQDGGACSPCGDDRRQIGQIGGKRHDPVKPFGIGDNRLGPGITQAVGQRIVSEQGKQRQRDRGAFHHGEMGDQSGGMLGQKDRDPVAAPDPLRGQSSRQGVGGAFELAIAPKRPPALWIAMDDRHPIRCCGGPAVAAQISDVE